MVASTLPEPWLHYRAKVAALSRDRLADDPELIQARRDLKAARLADHVSRALADAPPLSDEQRASIARLLFAADVCPTSVGGGLREAG